MKTYVRIDLGRVVEIIPPFFDDQGDYVEIENRYTPEYVASCVEITGISPAPQIGWSAENNGGTWSFAEYVEPPPAPEEILASQSAKLQSLNQLAVLQKTALTNRIGTINDSIDLDMATNEEISELPLRQAQLIEWKRYAVYLGRVTTQEGWPPNVVWPEQPEAGMDLTVSAVAGKSADFK